MSAFSPLGKTYLIPVDSTAPDGVQCSSNPAGRATLYRIINTYTAVVHMAYGATAALAKAAAVAPTGGTPQNVISIRTGESIIVAAPADTFWSGIAAGAASVFVTPVGEE